MGSGAGAATSAVCGDSTRADSAVKTTPTTAAAATAIATSMRIVPFGVGRRRIGACAASSVAECCADRSIFLSQIFWASRRRANSRLLPAPVLRRASRKRSLIEASDRPRRTAIDLTVCPAVSSRSTSSSLSLRASTGQADRSEAGMLHAHHRHPQASIPIFLGHRGGRRPARSATRKRAVVRRASRARS